MANFRVNAEAGKWAYHHNPPGRARTGTAQQTWQLKMWFKISQNILDMPSGWPGSFPDPDCGRFRRDGRSEGFSGELGCDTGYYPGGTGSQLGVWEFPETKPAIEVLLDGKPSLMWGFDNLVFGNGVYGFLLTLNNNPARCVEGSAAFLANAVARPQLAGGL